MSINGKRLALKVALFVAQSLMLVISILAMSSLFFSTVLYVWVVVCVVINFSSPPSLHMLIISTAMTGATGVTWLYLSTVYDLEKKLDESLS